MHSFSFSFCTVLLLTIINGSSPLESGSNLSFIEEVGDIDIITKMILMRDNIIIDPTAALEADEEMMTRLMEFLYVNSHRPHGPGGRLILPTLDRRDIGCDAIGEHDERVGAFCDLVVRNSHCLSPSDLMNHLPPGPVALSQSVAYLCPLILFRLSHPICMAGGDYRPTLRDQPDKIKLLEPTTEKVWGFGVLFVTLSIVVSMGGLIML